MLKTLNHQVSYFSRVASRITAEPWLIFWLLVCAFVARWIWIAGITGDYGWAYEPAARILQGEVPYRDYISSLPPLMPYTLAPFVALFKGNLWAWQIHLYLWWVASLAIGLQLAKKLGADAKTQTAAVFLSAVLSYPASWTGVPHNYAAAAFFGATLLALLAFRKSLASRFAVFAGVCVTFATFAKQNIGAAAFFAAVVGLFEALQRAGKLSRAPKTFAWFLFGASATFLPFLLYFGARAGLSETLNQFAIDGGGGKGVGRMLIHILPVFYFEPGVPNRHVLDIAVTLIANALFLWFFAAKISRRFTRSAEAVAEDWWILIALAIVIFLSVATLVSLPVLKSILLRASYYFSYGSLVVFIYTAVITFASVVFLRATLNRAWNFDIIVCLWLIFLVLSFALSLGLSSIYAAPIATPLIFWLLKEYRLIEHGFRLTAFCSIVATMFVSFLPTLTFTPTFERLYPLSENRNFAGLYGNGDFAWKVKQITENISSVVQNHTTLWLTMGGPHLAFGGKPVRAVPLMHEDTYGLRAEAPLMEEWQRNPPEFIVHQKSLPVRAGSKFFTDAYVSKWLADQYQLIWYQPALDLGLWKSNQKSDKR